VRLAALLAFVLSAVAAQAYEVSVKGVRIVDPWTPATLRLPLGNAVYMTIVNETGAPLRLTGVRTDVARAGTLHHTVTADDGVARMLRIVEVEIAPREVLRLEPLEMHVMLTALDAPLTEGNTFPLTLIFREVGEVTVDVMVKRATAQRPRPRP